MAKYFGWLFGWIVALGYLLWEFKVEFLFILVSITMGGVLLVAGITACVLVDAGLM